jgi:hypothetical protein
MRVNLAVNNIFLRLNWLKIKITGYKLLFWKTAYILFFEKTAYTLFWWLA